MCPSITPALTPSRPLVALTGRRVSAALMPDLESRYREHAVDWYFSAFAEAVNAAGGMPVELPYECDAGIIDRVDALIVTGGQDVHPARWGGDPSCVIGPVDELRDAYEATLIGAALERGIPVLGVCRGMQLLNVVRGGTLVGDLPAGEIDHVSAGSPTGRRTHGVRSDDGSLARSLFGAEWTVNSLHHQAVGRPGDGVVVTGRAPDGAAEVLEMPGRPVLGVQWHPEWHEQGDPSFTWVVNAAADIAFGCYGPSDAPTSIYRPTEPIDSDRRAMTP